MTQVGRAVETPDVAPESGARPTGHQPSEARHWRYSLPGLAGALMFVCLSLSPSLLPRTGARTTHRSWQVFTVVSCVCLVAAMTFGRY